MSKMGMGIPRSHNKIYPVAAVSLILCFKCIIEVEKKSGGANKLRVSNNCLAHVYLPAHEFIAHMSWLLFVLGALATFRLAHLVSKERGPFAIFERIRKAMPGGWGSPKEWLSCIFCFSLTSSAVVCGILWTSGVKLEWGVWFLSWLGFSSITLIINQVFRFDK